MAFETTLILRLHFDFLCTNKVYVGLQKNSSDLVMSRLVVLSLFQRTCHASICDVIVCTKFLPVH